MKTYFSLLVALSLCSMSVASPWVQKFGGTGGDAGSAVTTDTNGNIFLAGFFSSTANFGGTNLVNPSATSVLVLAKYNNSGTHQWSVGFPSASSAGVSPVGIALDGSGNIYVAGWYGGTVNFGGTNMASAGSQDCFLAKYTATGNHVWSRSFGGANTDEFLALTIDSSGNPIVTGTFLGSVNFGNGVLQSQFGLQAAMVLAKYNSVTGSNIWAENFNSGNSSYGYGIAVDSSDNILVTGTFAPTINFGNGVLTNAGISSNPSTYVAKFNSSGSNIWANRHGGTQGQRGTAIAVDRNNDVIAGGLFTQSTDLGGGTVNGTGFYTDMYIAKYSGASGAYVWGLPLLDDNGGQINSIATDSQNNIVIAGYYYGTAHFGTIPLTSVNGSYDGFTAKFTTGSAGVPGTVVFATSFGGSATDEANSVAVDSSGHPIVTGFFSGTCTFGSTNFTSFGGNDAFLQLIGSSNQFSFSGATVYSLTAGQSTNITVTYTAPANSSSSSNAVIFTDNGGGFTAPVTGSSPAPPTIVGGGGGTVSAYYGDSVTFTPPLLTGGSPPIYYRWRQDSTYRTAATQTPTFTIASVVTTDIGNYFCEITNASGGVTSAPVQLRLSQNLTTPPGIARVWTNWATSLSVANGQFFNEIRGIYISQTNYNPAVLVLTYTYVKGGGTYTNIALLPDNQALLIAKTNYYDANGSLQAWYISNPEASLSPFDPFKPSIFMLASGPITETASLIVLLTNAPRNISLVITNAVESPAVSVVDTINNPSSGTTSDSLFPASTSKELVVDVMVVANSFFTKDGPQTLLAPSFKIGNGTGFMGSYKTGAIGTNTTLMRWTGNDWMSHIAVSIKGNTLAPPTSLTIGTISGGGFSL